MLQRLDWIDRERTCQQLLLDYYRAGWAAADPARILEAAAPNYHFYDPLVGLFSRLTLAHYFEILRRKCARAGSIERRDLSFILSVPMHGSTDQYWRDAPQIGLTGIAQIVVGP